MRAWAFLILIGWIGVIAVQFAASATAVATTPFAMPGMGCDCPMSKPDCQKPGSPDKGCLLDPDCMARCTFMQPAIEGPILVPLDLVAAVTGIAMRPVPPPHQFGIPPERPPKLLILI